MKIVELTAGEVVTIRFELNKEREVLQGSLEKDIDDHFRELVTKEVEKINTILKKLETKKLEL